MRGEEYQIMSKPSTLTTAEEFPLSYGQAIDAAMSGYTVIAEVWQTRYVYDSEDACLLCINGDRPAHAQIAGMWRVDYPVSEQAIQEALREYIQHTGSIKAIAETITVPITDYLARRAMERLQEISTHVTMAMEIINHVREGYKHDI